MEMMLVVDHERCTGCRLCEMVCSVKHTGVNSPSRSRIHVIKWPMEGFELPMLCQQCEDAPCVAICPKEALSHDGGLGCVTLNYDLCIGCKMCVIACPFGGMGVDAADRRVIKCDLCDGDPTCVRSCSPGALRFLPIHAVSLSKKREAGLRLSEVMRRTLTAGQ